MFNWFSRRKLEDVVKPLTLEALKRLARIVVVDDEPDSVPTDGLKANGYSVDYWPDLDANRLARLERGEFDVVVLDIQGIVAPGLSDTGNGLGVLRRLKHANPTQTVIACSGQSYSIDAMDFYRAADATLAKPISLIRAMETIDEILRTRIGAGYYWNGLVEMLRQSGVTEARIRKLEGEVAKAVSRGTSITVERVEQIVGHIGTIATIGELVKRAILFAGGP